MDRQLSFRNVQSYQEAKDDDKDEEKETILPAMSEGESLDLKELEKTQHFTSSPRYTEASLVKKLEELGIGRPSTYASTQSSTR